MRLSRRWLNLELSYKGTLIPTTLNIENKRVLNNLFRNWMCLWTTTDSPWYLFTNTSFLDHQNEGPSADPKGLRPFCCSRLFFFPSTYNGKLFWIFFPTNSKHEDIYRVTFFKHGMSGYNILIGALGCFLNKKGEYESTVSALEFCTM